MKYKNGSYLIENKTMTGYFYRLTVSNGSYTLFKPILNGLYAFSRITTAQTVSDHFNIVKTLKNEKKRYNIQWIINGVVKETIYVNGTYPIIKWKIQKMREGAYKKGLLIKVEI